MDGIVHPWPTPVHTLVQESTLAWLALEVQCKRIVPTLGPHLTPRLGTSVQPWLYPHASGEGEGGEGQGRGEFMGGEQLVVNQIVARLADWPVKTVGNEWLDNGKKKLHGKKISIGES